MSDTKHTPTTLDYGQLVASVQNVKADSRERLEIEIEHLRRLNYDALHFIGQAGKILEQMEEFWANGTPIAAGSLLAIEFQNWGKRVMQGPLPSNSHAALVEALKTASVCASRHGEVGMLKEIHAALRAAGG